jgi:citrate synthase
MNKISTSVLSLYAYDENPDDTSLENLLRQSIELVAMVPIIAAHAFAVYRNAFNGKSLMLHNPKLDLSTAENFLRILRTDKAYTDDEAKLLDICLVLHAEHGGGNNSTFASRVVASTGTDIYSAIAAGVGSLKGPKHGGANLKVVEMFDDIKKYLDGKSDDDSILDCLCAIMRKEVGDKSGLIYGMGHAVYTVSDPRAKILKEYARKLADKNKSSHDDLAILEAIERLTPKAFDIVRGESDRIICANVDLYSGFVYRMLRIPPELYSPLFAIARVAGWCGHIIEEIMGGRLIRPGYKCIAAPREYVPITDR